ncbi:hypothetical protein DSL72_007488 [Monilinia vaccinii-corymbosi]|uniref:Chitin biosynthesis protein CHS5 n=1 Tax=Monilinia vaccinii-corymbosi TaxID=61207 RepID=A0A8A3PHZ1_9HELO|nr:hypothetical protein DSL72_007488 [Monilinia vaccinii-corymbosi]
MVRRIRAAVTESLNKHGYDFSGKRIIAAGTEKVGQGEDLFGTMVLSAREPALTAKIDVVREQAGQAVSKMIEVSLQRSKRGDSNTHQGWGRHKKPSGFNQVRRIEFPSILLPPNISSGSIVDITVSRNLVSEEKSQKSFLALQDSIFKSFGASEPSPPVLRCRNATQTSVVLEWDPIDLATADVISLSLFRNGQKAGNIPRPSQMLSTKISGLAVDTEYSFHLVLRTSAGTYSSEKVVVKTHKMTDLSGITITPGILPPSLRDSLVKAVERIGAKMADSVRIDTTHFVTTEGRGIAWEKAVEMNIPVVRPEWVEGCERGGRIVGVRQYYLDADPKQRQVVSNAPPPHPSQTGPPKEQARTSPTSPPPRNGPNGQTVPPTPPAKDTPAADKQEKEKEQEEEEEDSNSESERDEEKGGKEEDEKTAAPEEQKSRASDVEQRKMALRPVAPFGVSADDLTKSGEENTSGNQTPGNASFQDVAL